ncbi:hypothetical protein [Cellulosilyticum sp. WCF-2]|uniref:hypothetical protein n=1 Tax=Cellulosilyticum sp. WCF-2 TaxID=2497860 RepID=UPI000F8D17A2|nr:hypothetical protein [Cellulosilyticum sp. WCF-2]QEH67299.1 hypothetical protein EKH84_02145 [Cellulosilyticum sp. WCF-2]
MGMSVIVTGNRETVERKIRILKTQIELDINKEDSRSLVNHQLALEAHEDRVNKLNAEGVV